ncbi:MAG: TetR/AcrR family transcriptional regulator [Clostridiaceae bacterium]
MPKILENIRELLVAEGRSVLLKKSYKDFNIREISKNVGIGIGTFYNYFNNKEELAIEIFMTDWRKVLLHLDVLKTTDISFYDKLNYLYKDLQSFLNSYLPIFYEIAFINGSFNRDAGHMNLMYEKLEELIDIEKQKGTITNQLSSIKLSKFILSNLSSLCKDQYLTFDEFYNSLKL